MSEWFTGQKWGSPGFGQPGEQVTWSFATIWSKFQTFDQSIVAEPFRASVRAAFDLWESVANIDFVEVADTPSSNIRLAWDDIDGVGGTLGEAHWQFIGTTITYCEIAFDLSDQWQASAGDGPNLFNFFSVAVHEIGHSIGLGHPDDLSSIMYPYYNGQTVLSASDISAVQTLYGPAEPANQDTVPQSPGPSDMPDDTALIDLSIGAQDGLFDVQRFYNTNAGTHFYTASAEEAANIMEGLPGYVYEGNAFDVNEGADTSVFRFYNQETGTHFFTSSEEERDHVRENLAPTLEYEGVGYLAYSEDAPGRDALHRFYNSETGTHFYTASDAERIQIIGTLPNYTYEGIGYYVDAA